MGIIQPHKKHWKSFSPNISSFNRSRQKALRNINAQVNCKSHLVIQIYGIPLKVMWKNLILAGSSQKGKGKGQKCRMHEKSFKGYKLDSERQFCFMEQYNAGFNWHILVNWFGYQVLSPKQQWWKFAIKQTVNYYIPFWIKYQIQQAYVNGHQTGNYEPFDKNVLNMSCFSETHRK